MIVPHAYLTRIKDYFKAQTKTWDFFASQKNREQEWNDFKTNLLKNAYRMSADSESELYKRLEDVKQKLDIQTDITLYQLENNNESNAFVSFQSNEAHLVFCGPILKLLQGDELNALIAHELSHIKLYTIENGDYRIANSIITAIANDSRSETVFLETARYFRLYTEIYCDRGALMATGSEEKAQASLIKIHTGLEKVSAANYLEQAREILQANTGIKSETDTHPENFIRVLAVNLYNTAPENADEEIARLIEQQFDMDTLDIFRQQKLAGHTRYLLHQFVKPKWVQTDAIMAICNQYFSDFSKSSTDNTIWQADLFNANVKDYFSYILLDLAFADPQLENVPLGRAFQLSEEFGFKDAYNNVLKKEKKLSDKRLRELQLKSLESLKTVEA